MKLHHEYLTKACVNGLEYHADEDGNIDVPLEAAGKLIAGLGFVKAKEGSARRAKAAKPKPIKARKARPKRILGVDPLELYRFIMAITSEPINKWKKPLFREVLTHIGENVADLSHNDMKSVANCKIGIILQGRGLGEGWLFDNGKRA
jgi:hypothetical protein